MANAERAAWSLYSVFAGTEPEIRERITKGDGSALLIADITSLSYAIKRINSDLTLTSVESGTLTIADVWFDTWQYDTTGRFSTAGGVGYNFMKTFAATNLTAYLGVATTYEVTVSGVKAADGGPFAVVTAKITVSPRP